MKMLGEIFMISKLKKVYNNLCKIEWIDKEVQAMKNQNQKEEEKIEEMNSRLENLSKDIQFIKNQTNEILFAEIFHDTTKNSTWFHKDLSLSSGAIGYPLAYILYRTLNDIHPKSILELGLGQSTKIITEYVKANPKVTHDVVEHNPEWIDFFKRGTDLQEIQKIHYLPNYKRTFKGCEVNAYKNFKKEFASSKFDFILIDGPVGWGQEYSRLDILDILPQCLNSSFVIILDDCERIGEKRMMEMLEEKLYNHKIKYKTGYQYWGTTSVYICVSEDLEFLCHI